MPMPSGLPSFTQMKISILTVWYPSLPQREAEFLHCLKTNLELAFVDKVHVLAQPGVTVPIKHDKLSIINLEGRPTFKQLFAYANKLSGLVMLSNTDISYDNTLGKVAQVSDWNRKLMCLTHILDGKLRNPGCFSTWIFKSPIEDFGMDMVFGIEGCDSFLAQMALEAGMLVENPCLSINCWHHHKDDIGRITTLPDGSTYWNHPKYRCQEIPYSTLTI